MTRYTRLDAIAVRETVDRLERRMTARFPDRNLPKVAGELSRTIDRLLIRSGAPRYRLLWIVSRILIVALLIGLAVAIALLLAGTGIDPAGPATWEWASIIESMVNDVVFAGIAIFFLWHVPNRLQRNHDLRNLHALRSLAHVIDMHQLTKDPERLRAGFRRTDQTIEVKLDVHELWAYLDYCSELLSLVGKAAALFAERNSDDTVLATVEGIEELTTGMSRKIWQKIALLPK